MKSNLQQILRFGYIPVLMTLALSCSDASVEVSLPRLVPTNCENDAYEDESCSNDPLGNQDQGYMQDSKDMNMEMELSEFCSYLAVNESEPPINLCLDTLTFPLLESEDPQAWCGQSGQLAQALRLSQDRQCHDRDGDCWYECDSWSLPSIWQDLDDRRSLITGNEAERTPDDPAIISMDMDMEPTAPDPPQESLSSCINQALNPDQDTDSQLSCHYELLNASTTLFPCVKDAIAVVYESNEQLELSLQRITRSTLEEDHRVSIDFMPQSVLCTLGEHESWIVLLFGERPHQVYEFSRQRINNLIYEPNAQDLYEQVTTGSFELQDLQINQDNLQSWSYQLSSMEASIEQNRRFTFKRLDQGLIFGEEVAENIITQQFLSNEDSSVRELDLRLAYLDSDFSVLLKNETSEFEYELFRQFKPFQDLKSSEIFLALIPRNISGNMLAESQKIFFSFWDDVDEFTQESIESSLLDFPLIFDAQVWGFDSVILSKVTGNKALLKLRTEQNTTDETSTESSDPSIGKYVWGVYDILTDRLQIVELMQIAQTLGITVEDTPSLSDPNLHSSWVSWLLKDGENNYLITHELN
ncbi:MAG: hypothetical protein CMH49_02860 [Myxococcales bacterium]|nr:hypothetical protein [Myxococcales bacterium]